MPTPFKIDIPQSTLDAIRAGVKAYEWHEMPRGNGLEGSWAYGANLDFMRALCAYWVDGYDWRKWERELNRFPQFAERVEDLDIHFYHEQGSGPSPKPLILSHGWPGSVFEFLHIIEPLAHPERFGGDAKDAFTVVVPSLPGYGFSGKPARPISPRTIARHFDRLMTDVLSLPGYIAQGGDWGASISGWLGYEGKGCRAVHLNMMGWRSPGVRPETEEELAAAKAGSQTFDAEGAYFREQSTKPQTLSYAMMDSPVGTAAWIVEKFHGWSDIRKGFETVYTKDQLLTNVMIYLVTRSFNTATWLYRGLFEDLSGVAVSPKTRIEKRVAVARFPVDLIPFPPRSLVERNYNVVRWTEFAEGGHFAALERPDDLVGDIRAFAREFLNEITHRNFSGAWRAIIERSHFRTDTPRKLLMGIAHDEPVIRHKALTIFEDGTERFTEIRYAVGHESDAVIGGLPAKTVARWHDAELVIESRLTIPNGEMHLVDHWSLSSDGTILTMEHRNDALTGQICVLELVDSDDD